jgi:hypothetical protein
MDYVVPAWSQGIVRVGSRDVRVESDSMRHVFVETNWVAAYAAPGHHKIPAALERLNSARHRSTTPPSWFHGRELQ